MIRVDAIADRDYQATVSDISLLARTDFQSGWPPPKQFDLKLTLRDPDTRLRPGMSAMARITVGRLPDVLLVPSSTIFYEEGRTVVYRAGRRGFTPTPVEVVRRGRDQAAISGSIAAGDRIARTRPGEPGAEGAAAMTRPRTVVALVIVAACSRGHGGRRSDAAARFRAWPRPARRCPRAASSAGRSSSPSTCTAICVRRGSSRSWRPRSARPSAF